VKHRRIIVTHYGGPDAIQVLEEECPEPKEGEVRVKVLAAGVSLPDIMAREGVHPETPRVPFTPGWDLVGVVDRIGDGVSGIEPGQTVAALPIHGAYAEFVCLPQRELVPVPSGLDAAEAVSLILNYVTVVVSPAVHRLGDELRTIVDFDYARPAATGRNAFQRAHHILSLQTLPDFNGPGLPVCSCRRQSTPAACGHRTGHRPQNPWLQISLIALTSRLG
jgi:hypothetical protein